MTTIAVYRSSKELFYNLTLRELRSKYKLSFLGWTWSLVNPLALTVTYTVVFKYFLKTNPPVGDPSGLNSSRFTCSVACCRGTSSRTA